MYKLTTNPSSSQAREVQDFNFSALNACPCCLQGTSCVASGNIMVIWSSFLSRQKRPFYLLGFFSIHCTCIINMQFGFLLCRKWSDLKTSHVNGMITCWLRLWRVNKEENLKNSDSKKRKSSKSCRYKIHSSIMKQMIDSYFFITTFFFFSLSPEVITLKLSKLP